MRAVLKVCTGNILIKRWVRLTEHEALGVCSMNMKARQQ